MSCSRPYYDDKILNLNGEPVPIPCGQCFCCRLDLQKKYVDRMFCAYHSHDCSAFVTFTYDDDHLFIKDGFLNASLVKEDLHKYLDNIKHQLKNVDFEYFACGEYGDKFNRPHYHVLFFGLDYQLHEKFFKKTWHKGLVKVLPCSSKAFKYVSKYIVKDTAFDNSHYYDIGLIPPFRKISRGLGSRVYNRYLSDIFRYGYFVFKSRKIVVNRYYFNRLTLHSPLSRVYREQCIDDRFRDIQLDSSNANLPIYDFIRQNNDALEAQLKSRCIRKTCKSF